jgi:hypothetical protein
MSEYEFKKGDWIALPDSDEPNKVWVVDMGPDADGEYRIEDQYGESSYRKPEYLKMVRAFGDQTVEPEAILETPDHHKVTIVSFQGAIEREVKRVVKRMSVVESISTYDIHIRARGDLHEDTTEIEFSVGTKYASEVSANTLDAALDEFMRRHGWEADNKVKQIAMRSIPI